MNINYYAPGTSTEYRMWAVHQIAKRFLSAELVAVHDHHGVIDAVMVEIESCGDVVSTEYLSSILRFVDTLPFTYYSNISGDASTPL